jgi:anti-sigma regulatory factor (Ser/Thr protein kinase)
MVVDRGSAAAHRVRLPADPVSVPAARRVVRDALHAWDEPELVPDALVVTSELTTNATLHSGADFFSLELTRPAPGALVVAVIDDGFVPAEAVGTRPAELASRSEEVITGRGLSIVAALSAQWGVEQTPTGKRVWAGLGDGSSLAAPAPIVTVPAQAAAEATAPPPGWHVVRLVDCPVELSLRQDDHLDELIRDLQLSEPSSDEGSVAELSAQMRQVLTKHAHARHMGRLTAQRAATAGLAQVTVEMTVPAEAAEDVAELHVAVNAADALARAGLLLLEPSSPEVTALREWMAAEFVRQIRNRQQPTPYGRWTSRLTDESTPVSSVDV